MVLELLLYVFPLRLFLLLLFLLVAAGVVCFLLLLMLLRLLLFIFPATAFAGTNKDSHFAVDESTATPGDGYEGMIYRHRKRDELLLKTSYYIIVGSD